MIQISNLLANKALDAIVGVFSSGSYINIYVGSAPTSLSDSDTATILATINLPAPWAAAASSRSVSKTDNWPTVTVQEDGKAGHYRIFTSNGTAQWQGSVGVKGSDSDMTIQKTSTNLETGESLSVDRFVLNMPGNV